MIDKTSHRRSRRRATAAAVGLLLFLPGCSRPTWMMTRSEAGNWATTLRTSQDSGQRRKAISKLADSRYARQPSTVIALCGAARWDPSTPVRLDAVRALGRLQSPEAVPTLLALLGDEALLLEQEPAAEGLGGSEDSPMVLPADPELRFEAIVGIETLVRADALPPAMRQATLAVALTLLRSDRARDVRVVAARVLGYFPRREVLEGLVQALQQDDFGVVYESERSLMRLTGVSFAHDTGQWKQWLAEVEDPFRDRGAMDRHLADEKPRRWWRFGL